MGDYWGINAALDNLTLIGVGVSDLLLTGLIVVSILSLCPRESRVAWSVVAVETGVLAFGLVWLASVGLN